MQAITRGLVEEWGYEGFFKHTEAVAEFYKEKRDAFEKAMQAHLGGLAEWRTPEAGMFFWYVFLHFGVVCHRRVRRGRPSNALHLLGLRPSVLGTLLHKIVY